MERNDGNVRVAVDRTAVDMIKYPMCRQWSSLLWEIR